MANWTKLTNGTWGIQTQTGTTGDRVTVTKANGQTARVTLGERVKRTRWGTVFTVAGSAAPRRTRRPRRVRSGPDLVAALASQDRMVSAARARNAAPVAVAVAPVAVAPVVDASVARFLLLDLDSAPAESAPEPVDDGPGRQLQID